VRPDRTPGGRSTWIPLALAISAVGLGLLLATLVLWPAQMAPMFNDRSSVLGLPSGTAIGLIGIGLFLAGVAWMIRIGRSGGDEAPPWRYADHGQGRAQRAMNTVVTLLAILGGVAVLAGLVLGARELLPWNVRHAILALPIGLIGAIAIGVMALVAVGIVIGYRLATADDSLPRRPPDAGRRTAAYWPTRILLATGIVAVAADIVWALPAVLAPPLFGPPPDVLGPAVGMALGLVGLVWMVRIYRGPRDEPAPWRYRDR
jgi:hypothetical protein